MRGRIVGTIVGETKALVPGVAQWGCVVLVNLDGRIQVMDVMVRLEV